MGSQYYVPLWEENSHRVLENEGHLTQLCWQVRHVMQVGQFRVRGLLKDDQ
jgi:hypothetical protein